MVKSFLEFEILQVMDKHGWKRGSGSPDDVLLAELDKAFEKFEAEMRDYYV